MPRSRPRFQREAHVGVYPVDAGDRSGELADGVTVVERRDRMMGAGREGHEKTAQKEAMLGIRGRPFTLISFILLRKGERGWNLQ
ncbi:MAG: hypothetical protein CM1200mP36_06790 [Gammaproteobacteria bacterium]|nr:MAG: hypothetical protein CM1200mP36_06790 [Gammaproteobacteria bacterium]